jgi:hypothetical protein
MRMGSASSRRHPHPRKIPAAIFVVQPADGLDVVLQRSAELLGKEDLPLAAALSKPHAHQVPLEVDV